MRQWRCPSSPNRSVGTQSPPQSCGLYANRMTIGSESRVHLDTFFRVFFAYCEACILPFSAPLLPKPWTRTTLTCSLNPLLSLRTCTHPCHMVTPPEAILRCWLLLPNSTTKPAREIRDNTQQNVPVSAIVAVDHGHIVGPKLQPPLDCLAHVEQLQQARLRELHGHFLHLETIVYACAIFLFGG